ncbi:hypothetical protein CEXT_662111 [Caerostris extrusa]|uniref:Uncharacterized protein n=1 Tax=Caerostris extrusa TaxID=172846 RepID=A0AAV4WQS5_CAEEX|nr:hypothetical protein CEXT_662111 [Caerostris extrusa]
MQKVFYNFSVSKGGKAICLSTYTNETINSHDAGLAQMQNVRLLIADELKKHQTLNCGFLKGVCGETTCKTAGESIPPKGSNSRGKLAWYS